MPDTTEDLPDDVQPDAELDPVVLAPGTENLTLEHDTEGNKLVRVEKDGQVLTIADDVNIKAQFIALGWKLA